MISDQHPPADRPKRAGRHVLIVEARFYDDISDLLLDGATGALAEADASHDRVIVPGALEIPAAVRLGLGRYDAFVALGCVIRGETAHYDIVAGESARGLMDLAVREGALIGNGILTCDNRQQARVRADPSHKNKGGDAVRAALALLAIRTCFAS